MRAVCDLLLEFGMYDRRLTQGVWGGPGPPEDNFLKFYAQNALKLIRKARICGNLSIENSNFHPSNIYYIFCWGVPYNLCRGLSFYSYYWGVHGRLCCIGGGMGVAAGPWPHLEFWLYID